MQESTKSSPTPYQETKKENKGLKMNKEPMMSQISDSEYPNVLQIT